MIAIKPSHVGRLHAALGMPMGKKLSMSMIQTALRSKDPKIRRMAQFALNARKWQK